jgi:hypothetical protein
VTGRARFGLTFASACLASLAVASTGSAATTATQLQPTASAGLAASGPVASSAPTGAAPQRHGARRFPHLSGAAPLTRAPQSPIAPLAAAPAQLLSNFNGVSSRDSAVTNFGQEFEPPDQGLCVGNGFVVEMVNSAYTVYKPDGSVVTGPFNVNGPFDEGLTEFTSDPRCYFDASTNTWFATILFINSDSTASTLDVAVNTSGDPTKVWKTYHIDTTGVGGQTGPKDPGCPCFGDQPTLGIDTNNLYVTTNEFSIVGPQFNGAQVYAFAKKDLVALVAKPHFVHFDNLSVGGAVAASVQPALTTGTPGAEYFLSSLDPNATFDQRVGVWALTNGAVVATGGKPKLSNVVLSSEVYGVPPGAEQKASTSLIDSGDDRMQQTQFINGSIWGELDTGVTIPNDPAQRAGAAWFDVRPVVAGGVITTAHMQRQGYVVMPGNYVLYPALQVTPSGSAAMVVSLTGPTRFPSAAYSVLAPGAASFGAINVAAAGTTNYNPASTRWGDYSWAVLDPSGNSVWLATEYVPPKSSQTPDGLQNWGTRVFDVKPGG